MAIIKMYIDADRDGDMENKVFEFFNEMSNTNTNAGSAN
jgi:hypothetical protein